MSFFRKKPVVIEAFKWTGGPDQTEDPEWMIDALEDGRASFGTNNRGRAAICINTLEGVMAADVGDWIIKGVKDEIYPCKPDIFEATYEAVTSH